ncbi:low molecular weight protein-tyrosine-phosphatase [Corynebacterium bovis]|uniref:protein-tyrosine-phosphatase n=1 Tax=Corynebacterium bovis TaxID=36808 RepID=A0A3R8PG85_9CORY|nr:low molecular weight protein-tyrosine-phosphatase [Corynebacterium bovis]RRO91495.1 protein-tyrosine-phosphatase [Corynebacterium bovis]RRO93576.1 protein-tyrosine-phosphatase [Corynebacterium bovis]RRO97276.1 protein-tyrosine-phosphatase [Corynebacterium bovis]RRQ00777.1 protein-tyrosine-phosphatase [Corynebacterium bovis]RRQ04163.1 protein-tyrosine-phosphatase [Corynebacterium bovis]
MTQDPTTQDARTPETGVDPDRPALHLCVVCTGNICRSPMGEVMLRDALDDAGLGDAVRVTSCGTHGYHIGQHADPRAVAQLAADGHDGSRHRAAEFGPRDEDADLFLAMTHGHVRELRGMGVDGDRIRLIRSFGPDGDEDVDDPYYGSADGFARVAREIREALPGVVDWVRAELR